jgi:hypothetical protein
MQGYDRSCETGPPALGSKVEIDERGGLRLQRFGRLLCNVS